MNHYTREAAWWLACCALALTAAYLPVLLDGGPTDEQAAADTEAALHDALAQAQAERPDLWDEASRARARAAARMVARQEVQP